MPLDDPYIFVNMVQHALGTPQLTPLQVHEIDLASRMAEANPKDTGELQKQCEQIKKHWTGISDTVLQRESTSNRLRILANNFVGLLLAEYRDMGPKMSNLSLRDIIKALGSVAQRQPGADEVTEGNVAELESTYKYMVIFAIDELMLDRQHVEDRFRAALRGEKLMPKPLDRDHDARLKQLIEKDLATLDQFVIFFEYDKAESRVSYDYIGGSSVWNLLGFGASGTESNSLAAIANLLRSDEGIQKEKRV